MYNIDEEIQAISIGIIIAGFCLNTNRFRKSIELCKECLFILNKKAGVKDEKLTKLFYVKIYFTMWKACSLTNDNTNAIKYAKSAAKLSSKLSEMYFHENEYTPATNLLEKALLIGKEIKDKHGQASSHLNLGVVYKAVGKYEKAREHLEKSLLLLKEIGHRSGEASCYTTLVVCIYQLANMTRLENISRNHL